MKGSKTLHKRTIQACLLQITLKATMNTIMVGKARLIIIKATTCKVIKVIRIQSSRLTTSSRVITSPKINTLINKPIDKIRNFSNKITSRWQVLSTTITCKLSTIKDIVHNNSSKYLMKTIEWKWATFRTIISTRL